MRTLILMALAGLLAAAPAPAHRLVQPRRAELRAGLTTLSLTVTEQLCDEAAAQLRERFDRDANARLDATERRAALDFLALRARREIRVLTGDAPLNMTATAVEADGEFSQPGPDSHPFVTVVLEAPLPPLAEVPLRVEDSGRDGGLALVVITPGRAAGEPSSGRAVTDERGRPTLRGVIVLPASPWTVTLQSPAP